MTELINDELLSVKCGLPVALIHKYADDGRIPFHIVNAEKFFSEFEAIESLFDIDELLNAAGVPDCIPIGNNPLFKDGEYMGKNH